MRKKSHISLTRYIINSMQEEGLYTHRKAFYIGSILPDCVPSFITRRHCIEDTFEILKKEIKKLIEDFDTKKDINSYYCRHLGVITHYVADYFTLPHNSIFDGSIKDHCIYENELKIQLREYVKTKQALRERDRAFEVKNVDDICSIIEQEHNKYVNSNKEIKNDINYIVTLCHRIVDYILQVFDHNRETVFAA